MDDQPTNCNMNFNQTSTTNSSSSRPSLQSRIQTSIDLNQSLHDHHPRSRPSRSINSNQPLVYPYSFDLLAHHGCVNAISFSKSSQGRWLATGGDDTRVLLWDTFSDFDQIKPVAVYNGPEANIFSIDFTANGNRVLALVLRKLNLIILSQIKLIDSLHFQSANLVTFFLGFRSGIIDFWSERDWTQRYMFMISKLRPWHHKQAKIPRVSRHKSSQDTQCVPQGTLDLFHHGYPTSHLVRVIRTLVDGSHVILKNQSVSYLPAKMVEWSSVI